MKLGLKYVAMAAGLVGVVTGALLSCSQKAVDGELMAKANPRAVPLLPSAIGPREKVVVEELKTIYFDYNQTQIKQPARQAILENAHWLKAHPEVAVQIEGHCDERGTREYNYKLGEKRAQKAKELLISFGISEDRIETVSYGAIGRQNEKSWQTNRRAVFVLIYPASKTPQDEIAKKSP